MIPELQAEADRLNDDQSLHDPTAYYQGTHIGVRFDENPVMERLANLPQARAAAEAIGMGDMNHGGGMIVLTKEAAGKKAAAPLYWHHVRRVCPVFARLRVAEPASVSAGWQPLERSAVLHPVATDHLFQLLLGGCIHRGRLPESHVRPATTAR